MRAGPLVTSALGALLAIAASCAETAPPPECQAYVDCFFPDGESPYAKDPTYVDEILPQREELLALYGAGGECWRFGVDDPFARRCRESCLSVIDAACRAFAAGDEGYCVEPRGDADWFQGGETALSCEHAAGEIAKLPSDGTPAP